MYLITWITTHLPTPKGWMDGWVGHVGWPIADGLTTKKKCSPVQLVVWRRIGKVFPAETSVLTTMLRRQHHINSTIVTNGGLRPDVRDRQTYRQTSDAHHRFNVPTLGAGHTNW